MRPSPSSRWNVGRRAASATSRSEGEARALRIHPNSLRYRLGRIEELTGRSLREPATIATLHLALLASAADGAPSGADG